MICLTKNGITVNRTFNAQTGRLSDVEAGVGDSVANFHYEWDALGNLDKREDANLGLTDAFTYNTANRLTEADTNGVTHGVGYTVTGNIAGKTQLGSASANFYSYPATGQSQPYGVTSITGMVNGQTNPSFAYDANGNMTSGAGRDYAWNAFQKVDTLEEGGLTINYTYDAEQQRRKRSFRGVIDTEVEV